MEDINPQEELNRIQEEIESATELAALRPVFYRLDELIRNFPGDFEVQFTGSELKLRLIARGTLLKQQAASAAPAAPLEHMAPPDLPPPSEFDSASPEDAAPPLAELPVYPPQPLSRPRIPLPPPPTRKRDRASVMVAVVCLLAVALTVWIVRLTRIGNAHMAAAIEVSITTTPPGAFIRAYSQHAGAGIGNEPVCISNCKLSLLPGTYQVSALLGGFELAKADLAVVPGQTPAVNLTLTSQSQSVRLATDLEHGKVVLDDQPAGDLEDGQFVLDRLGPGAHTVKVTGPDSDASFSFEIADARQPVVTGPITARNMITLVVTSFGTRARVVTNAGPWKLAVNGQPQADAGPDGTDLTSFQPGVNEFVVGEGPDRRSMSENFGAAPTLTAFLKTDVNAGTLIVSTGQNDVRVYVNGKEYPRRTRHGQVRIQTIGTVAVRVVKNGFEDPAPQTIEVKKGAEARLEFALKPQPKFGSLQVHGAPAGTEVLVDQKIAGAVAQDGSLNLGAIPPGDHIVELRREQYQPKQLERSFRAGQAVVLAGPDVALAAATGTVRFTRNPPTAAITYRRSDETDSHEARGAQVELPTGNYAFSASAPGFVASTVHVPLAAGENREVAFALARERPPAPAVVTGGIAEFTEPWEKDGSIWIHKGGGFVSYKLPPKGVFTFTVSLVKGGGVFRPGQIRWCLQHLDTKNYLLYEMDRKNFWAGVVQKGKRYERVKEPHNLGSQQSFTIRIEVTPDSAVQKVRVGQGWKTLDTFVEPGRDFTKGTFGFLIQGNDELAISNFSFLPK